MNRIIIAIIGTIWLLGAPPAGAAGHKEAKNRGQGDVAEAAEETVRAQDRAEQKERPKTQTRAHQASDDDSDDSDARGRGDGPAAAEAQKGDADERGRQQSEEMRARQEERKAIQEEYRSNREPGQEGQTQKEGEGEKKAWWKFWGD